MEIEAEHYSNGVAESSTRIMNGTYKHQEILQADDSSVGNGVAGTELRTRSNVMRCLRILQKLQLTYFMFFLHFGVNGSFSAALSFPRESF